MPELVKTTVDIKVEALYGHSGSTLVGSLVADALREFIAARPTTATGKFESKAGLDVTWTTRHEAVDENGKSLLSIAPMAQAVNDAVTA
jgi:hypothetical protein